MTQTTTVLITGANRGIGKGLLARYLSQPNHAVIAANRDPSHATSLALSELPRGAGSSLLVVKLDATADGDAAAAAAEILRRDHGVRRLDVVVANAGVAFAWPPVADLRIADLRAHVAVNVYGVVALYQAVRPLLRAAAEAEPGREPVFAAMGSFGGLIGKQPPFPNAAYGPTKAALNWLVRRINAIAFSTVTVRINAEDDWLNAFVLNPGWVQTDLGNAGARGLGLERAPLGVDESCDGIMKVLETSTKEKHGGKMVSYTGEVNTEW